MGTSRRVALAVGLVALVAGVVPTLAALDVIPTPDAEFGAPRWIVLLLVQPFVLLGLGITLHGLGLPARVLHVLGFAGGLVFVTAGSIFWTWLLFFGDAAGRAMIGVGPVAVPLPSAIGRPFNRTLITAAAILTITIAIVLWFSGLRKCMTAVRARSTRPVPRADEETTR